MAETLLVILITLSILAAITRETFVVVLFYVFAGSYLIGRWWSGYSIKKLATYRIFTDKVFPEETIQVKSKHPKFELAASGLGKNPGFLSC